MTILLKSLQFVFRLIFFLPAGPALTIMRAFARLVAITAKTTKIKKMAAENIRKLLPDIDANQTADRLISNTSSSLAEILCIPFFKKKHYQAVFKWQGLEHLNAALEQKKGVIILTMHAGNYEAVIPSLSQLGYPVNVVLRATDDPLFEIVNRSRSAQGAKLINVLEEDMFKASTKALADNELVYLLADTGALESRHELREFLGRKVPVATGWLTLAQRAGCPVIPTLAKRAGKQNIVTLYEPLTVTKDNREQIMQQASRVFETFIRKNPDHWAIFLNTYETQRMVEEK